VSSARHDAARPPAHARAGAFVVYVEGPRDGDILRSWARRVAPALARELVAATVILGGRQPARAVAHLRRLGADGAAARGLCVLDRDGGEAPALPEPDGVDLELFTWSRRHIESYLLVPEAIRRALGTRERGLDRLLREEIPPPDDEAALGAVDAKRLLDRRGPLARLLGRPIDPGRVARAMRADEIHPEVHALLWRIASGLGLEPPTPVVTVRLRSLP
jgi:hypothetical protein